MAVQVIALQHVRRPATVFQTAVHGGKQRERREFCRQPGCSLFWNGRQRPAPAGASAALIGATRSSPGAMILGDGITRSQRSVPVRQRPQVQALLSAGARGRRRGQDAPPHRRGRAGALPLCLCGRRVRREILHGGVGGVLPVGRGSRRRRRLAGVRDHVRPVLRLFVRARSGGGRLADWVAHRAARAALPAPRGRILPRSPSRLHRPGVQEPSELLRRRIDRARPSDGAQGRSDRPPLSRARAERVAYTAAWAT